MKYLSLLKIALVFMLLFSIGSLYSQDPTDLSWQEAEPFLRENAANKTRCRYCLNTTDDYYRWISAVNTTEEKIEITKLLLVAVDGQYTDLIYWGFGRLLVQYDTLFYYSAESKKPEVFKRELKDILDILKVLDTQISRGYKSEQKLDTLYNKHWQLIQKNNFDEGSLRYKIICKQIKKAKETNNNNLIYTDLTYHRKGNDLLRYHKQEIKKLRRLKSSVRRNFLIEDYERALDEMSQIGELKRMFRFKY